MNILESTDYDSFKLASFNRSINKGNLKKLIDLNRINNNLRFFPIVIDSNGVIIDGQHRYMASKELGLPVYYIINDFLEASPDSVYEVNIAGRRHTISDRVQMLAKSGNPAALKAIDLSIKYSSIPLVAIVELMYLKGNNLAKTMLEQGLLPTSSALKIIEDIASLPPLKKSNRLARAYTSIIRDNPDVAHKLARRLSDNWEFVFDGGREKDVKRSLVAAYNKGLRGDNRISIKL